MSHISAVATETKSRLSSEQVRVLGVSTLGAMLEYYEFIVFLFLTPILSVVLFPSDMAPWLKQLQTLGIFASGYLVRPFGGVFLARVGDKIGRKKMFVTTLALMAVPTLLIGLLPTYAQIGLVAPIILLLLRMCQGLAMGGELPTALTFIAEHVPEKRLGVSVGCITAANSIGTILAVTMVFSMGRAFGSEGMLEYGWRVPFIVGAVFGFISIYLRRHVAETPVFEMLKQRALNARRPVFSTLFKEFPSVVIVCLLLSSATAGVLTSSILYPVSHFQSILGFPGEAVNAAQLATSLAIGFGVLFQGWLGDKIGYVRTIMLFSFLSIPAFFWLFTEPSVEILTVRWMIVGFCISFTSLVLVLLVKSFTADVRITGIALTYNTSQALVSGIMPVLLGSIAPVYPQALLWFPVGFALLALAIVPFSMKQLKPIDSLSFS